jgi:hypothetical protein
MEIMMTDLLVLPCHCGGELTEIQKYLLECNSCKRLVDSRLICGACLGNLVVVGEKNGQKIFNCDRCHNNEMLECMICHLPKSIWADDGKICGLCYFAFTEGKINLTPQELDRINRWKIHV